MPGGDRTGPMGMGPMTGRAAGYCAGSAAPGFVSAPGGRGFGGGGRGQGGGGRGGRGRRNQFHATGLTGWQRAAAGMPAFGGGRFAAVPQTGFGAPPAMGAEQEVDLLKQQAEYLASALEGVNKRIEALETQFQKQ